MSSLSAFARALGGGVLGMASLLVVAATPDPLDPPTDYRRSHYRAPTPTHLAGATTVTTSQLAAQLDNVPPPLLIDVLPANRVTDAEGQPRWIPPQPRHHLPNSLWLPQVGEGEPAADVVAWFSRVLAARTGGRLDTPVVFYCLRDCWMSWNAARRAVLLGYRQVQWYPEGTDGWAAAGLPLVVGTPLSMGAE